MPDEQNDCERNEKPINIALHLLIKETNSFMYSTLEMREFETDQMSAFEHFSVHWPNRIPMLFN